MHGYKESDRMREGESERVRPRERDGESMCRRSKRELRSARMHINMQTESRDNSRIIDCVV